ncbi:MAG: beta-ketoacyl-[acyl-carrier-protein] synthase II, partial [Myxococcales bacterium]|nr:beta-ketoacyl-[acyl-carrier-protein] synthase II [Myxococcales bacterium]
MRTGTRRVVVTGIGLVTPVAVGTEENWQGLLAGQSGLGPITAFDASEHTVRIAGEVRDFDAEAYVGRKDAKKMDRFIHFAIAATRMAMADADLPIPVPDPDRTGVIIGVGMGGLATIEEAAEVLRTKGPKRLSPFMLPRLLANLAPGQVSIMIGSHGPNWCPVSACATGAHGVGEAARLISHGDLDVAVA